MSALASRKRLPAHKIGSNAIKASGSGVVSPNKEPPSVSAGGSKKPKVHMECLSQLRQLLKAKLF